LSRDARTLLSVLVLGLTLGWVAGSWYPWGLPALVLMGLASFGWIIYSIVTFHRDMDDWEAHAETMRLLLEEAEADQDESVLPDRSDRSGPEHQGGPES
jgi:hypothetical protein